MDRKLPEGDWGTDHFLLREGKGEGGGEWDIFYGMKFFCHLQIVHDFLSGQKLLQ